MPLAINSLGGGDTHTHIHAEKNLRNQAHAGLWPAPTWFKNYDYKKYYHTKISIHKSMFSLEHRNLTQKFSMHTINFNLGHQLSVASFTYV